LIRLLLLPVLLRLMRKSAWYAQSDVRPLMSDGPIAMSSPELELWQTEWCPSSHRVRQRLTELGLTYTARQVPVERTDRHELIGSTGHESIPVLVAGGVVVAGEEAIVTYLNTHVAEPTEAEQQRAKAAMMRNQELEEACPELATATP